MDIESQFKKLSSFADIIQISERFSIIKNQIDIDTERILLRINNEFMIVEDGNEYYHQHIHAINHTKANLIREIEGISKFNLDNYSKMHEDNMITDSLSEYYLFKEDCLYLDVDTVNDLSSNKCRLGLFIKANFYISEIQAEFLKKLVKNFKNTEPKANKQSISLNDFIESFYLNSKIIQSINSDQYTLDISETSFSEIIELKIQHDYSSGFLSITSGYKCKTKFSNLKVLHLTNLNIHKIDNCFFASDTLEELDLSRNKIESIKKGSFKDLKQIKRLILCLNKLQEIEPGLFDNLIELEELDLANNHLTDIGDNLFINLEKLTSLDLSKNRLKKIRSNSLEGLTSLKILKLRFNECSFEHGVTDKVPNLNFLSLYYNMILTAQDLNKLPAKNLREICFTSNSIMSAPLSWLKSHTNLRKIDIQFKQVSINKSLFENFNHLQELTISNTTVSLAKIPDNLINLTKITFQEVEFTLKSDTLFKIVPPKLEEVNLYMCRYNISKEPKQILKNIRNVKRISFVGKGSYHNILDNWKRIQCANIVISKDLWSNNRCITELDLSGNNIHTYHIKSLKGLDNLQKLTLSSNRLTHIQQGIFSSIKQIKHLDLSDNHIQFIDKNAFQDFCNMEYLDLSQNLIKYLGLLSCSHIFKNLKKLEFLDISSNIIERLDDDIFSDLSNLKYLNLNSNKIEEINSCLFRGTPLLSELDLSSNNIKTIGDSFCGLVNLEELRLHYNQIQNIDLKSLSKLKLKLLDLASNEIKQIEEADLNCLLYRGALQCEILLFDNPVYKSIYPVIYPFTCKFN